MKDKVCAICGGEVIKRKTTLDRMINGNLYLFENVEVLACNQCGEIWIPGRIAEKMDQIIQQHLKPKRKILVPVY